MKILFYLIVLVNIFSKCRTHNKVVFCQRSIEVGDSIKIYLFKDSFNVLDSFIFLDTRSAETSAYLKIKHNNFSWRCENDSVLLVIAKNYGVAKNYIIAEERFMNTIRSDLNINYCDRVLLIEYWKQLNPIQFISNLDKEWQSDIDNFYNLIVQNKLKISDSQFYIESCEKNQFDSIIKITLSDTLNSFYLTFKTHIPTDSIINTNAYLYKPFKKLTFLKTNEDKDYKIEIKDLIQVKYR